MNQNNSILFNSLTLPEVFSAFRNHWKFVVIAALLAGAAAGMYNLSQSKLYESYVSLKIGTVDNRPIETSQSVQDFLTRKSMAFISNESLRKAPEKLSNEKLLGIFEFKIKPTGAVITAISKEPGLSADYAKHAAKIIHTRHNKLIKEIRAGYANLFISEADLYKKMLLLSTYSSITPTTINSSHSKPPKFVLQWDRHLVLDCVFSVFLIGFILTVKLHTKELAK